MPGEEGTAGTTARGQYGWNGEGKREGIWVTPLRSKAHRAIKASKDSNFHAEWHKDTFSAQQ